MHKMAEGNNNPAKAVELVLHRMAEEGENPKEAEDSSALNPIFSLGFAVYQNNNKPKEEFLKASTLSLSSKEMADSIEIEAGKYLDIQSTLKQCYEALNHQCNTDLQEFKSQIEDRLNQSLQIEVKEQIQPIRIDYSKILNLSTTIPQSTLSYSYQETQRKLVSDSTWWNPFSWRNTKWVTTQGEKHNLTINPEEIQNALKETFQKATQSLQTQEIKQHQYAINAFGAESLNKAINGITEDKTQEINKIAQDIQDIQKNLSLTQKRQEAFQNTLENANINSQSN